MLIELTHPTSPAPFTSTALL